jgi:hypothetical protein
VPLASTATDDFGAGVYRGRKAPKNAAYDLVNVLINDEGIPFRRGGTAYYSSSAAPGDLDRMVVAYMRAVSANRVIVSTTTARYVLNGSLAPVTADNAEIDSRPALVGDYVAFVNDPTTIVLYAGSLMPAQYATGTVSVTAGSTSVTGAGTSWLANADGGMILATGSQGAVVKSVTTDTALTLADPWPGSTAAGAAYSLENTLYVTVFGTGATRSFVAAAGAGSPRLLHCIGNRVYFSERGDPLSFAETDYHQMPSLITGAEGRGDSALIFTTAGMWQVGNLSFDAVDAYGNIQHTVEEVNKDVILWDNDGIAGFAGGVVIPAIDDVFLTTGDGLKAITGSIRPLYRDYVAAGYGTGVAAVHRGHYFLPILNGSTLVDTLVCRLDRDHAWTRFAGHAAGRGYAQMIAEAATQPKLLGLAGARVTDLTGCFDPTSANATDADSTTSDLVIETRDFPTGGNQHGFAQRLRTRYEMDGVEQAYSDDFERADETPIASPYLNWLTGGKPNLAGGSCVDSGGFVSATTRPETIGPNCTVTANFDAQAVQDGFTFYFVGARLTAHSNSAGGYRAQLVPGTGSGWKVVLRRGSSAGTVIATSATTNYLDISGIRLACDGDQIVGSLKVSGNWTEAITVTDATYPAAGYVGFGISTFLGSPVGIEDFAWTVRPAVSVAFSSDADAGTFTDLTEKGEQGGGSGWADSDGSAYQWATVAKRRERIRFRVTVAGATASFVLRTLELLTRPTGKQ